MQETIFIGGGGEGYATPQSFKLKYANRYGSIVGATGICNRTAVLRHARETFAPCRGRRCGIGTGSHWSKS